MAASVDIGCTYLISDVSGIGTLPTWTVRFRVAGVEEELELLGVQGERIGLELFGRLTDRLGRTLQRIGLKRIPKDVTPNVDDYIAHINKEA